MKSLIKLSLSVLAASVLAACSGGGSSSTSSTPPSANPPVNPPASPPVVPPVNSPAKSGVWASSSDQPALITAVGEETALGLHILNIDGKDIYLTNTAKSGIRGVSFSKGQDVTYGRYNDPNKKDKDGQAVSYVFAYGNATAVDKIPTGGTFNYKGTATYGSEALNGFATGVVDANFTVDFQAKTVDGKITQATNNINLTLPTAKIDGNGFKGNSGDAFLNGQFYGENASSIGGVFGDNGTGAYLGAFSATKQ